MSAVSNSWEDRCDFFGASEAPIVMGVCPYMGIKDLWLEKLGLGSDREFNSSMKRGLELEPLALQCFQKKTGLIMKTQVRLYHPKYPWMMATLDGITDDGKNILEIKCPSKLVHLCAVEGKIPDRYYPQLQHQLAITGVDMAYYFSFDGEDGVVLTVHRDNKYIEHMHDRIIKFWKCVKNCVEPDW